MARAALAHEVDIIEIIKSRRFFHMAFRHLLSRKERMRLKELSRYYTIDPDVDEANNLHRLKILSSVNQ